LPRYQVRCPKCKKEWEAYAPVAERNNIRCETCGELVERQEVYQFAAHIWKPQWFEHLDTKPIYIESKKQLKREAEKRGLIAVGLE